MKAVIFDMDGVIVDSEPMTHKHREEFLAELGADLSKLPLLARPGLNSQSTWKLLRAEYKLEHEVDVLVQRERQHYLNFLETVEELPIIDGVKELLSALHERNYRVGLASSASPQRIDLIFERLNLAKEFEIIVSGDDVKNGKPEPDCYLLAAKKLGVEPKNCVVIEDARFGVRAAKAAGMKCFGFLGLPHNVEDLSEADIIVKDFHKLAEFVKNGNQLLDYKD